MRRLPIYILVECSQDTAEDLPSVREGIVALVAALRQDHPEVLETGYVSIITFAAQARQQSPLAELVGFSLPSKFEAGHGCMFGRAMGLLVESYNKEFKQTTAIQKGDWKPSLLVIASGNSEDDFFRKMDLPPLMAELFSIVVVAAGRNQNVENLTSFLRQSLAKSQKNLGEDDPDPVSFSLWGQYHGQLGNSKLLVEHSRMFAQSLFPISPS